MKKIIVTIVLLLFVIPVYAGPPSILGGKMMPGGTAHYVSIGWPSLSYEWWHSGNPDWAIGGELVYGDWSGEFSNVKIGFALNVPMRWHLHQEGRTDIAFRLVPGALIGNMDGPGSDPFVFGIRSEMGIPITIDLDDRINLITGATVPFTVLFVEDADTVVIVPILARIGVEFAASETITPSLLMEVGPTMAFGDFGSEIELGFRVMAGATFW